MSLLAKKNVDDRLSVANATAAIILAGSHIWGDRSFELLGPRALLPIANAPLIEHVMNWLEACGVRVIIVSTNDAGSFLGSSFLQHQLNGRSGLYLFEDRVPRGPAGCSHDATAIVEAEHYVVVEGAVLPGCDLRSLLRSHVASRAAASVVVHPFAEGLDGHRSLGPAGIYVLARRALAQVSPIGYQDIKEMLIPELRRVRQTVLAYSFEEASTRIEGLESYLAVQGCFLRRQCRDVLMARDYVCAGEACIHRRATVSDTARLVGPVMLGPGTHVGPDAIVVGPSVLGASCLLSSGAVLKRSVLWDSCVVGERAVVDQCVMTNRASVAPGAMVYAAILQADLSRLSLAG